MNGTFRTLAMAAASVGALAMAAACSSPTGSYGDACTVYAVEAPCDTGLECRCRDNGCFCAKPCTDNSDCPGKYDQCVDGSNPATNAVGSFCFRFLADGGPLP